MQDKTFELLEKIYFEMQEGFKGVNGRLDKLENRVTIIEQDHGKKLTALFDGHNQNTQYLERIEKEVTRHDELIMKKVK